MANNRVYELMYIAQPTTSSDDLSQINKEIEELITKEGGEVVVNEEMGKRQLAYQIKKHTEGFYHLFEINGSGKEIAEVERRMRVNDNIIRYLTVRVDEERKTAAKIETKRENRKAKLAQLRADHAENEVGDEEDN